MTPLLLAIHILAAVFWVGGMAFAYTILRPAAGQFEPPIRLALWRRVFAGFLPWVGVSIVALLASGAGIVLAVFGGFDRLPLYVNAMMGLGVVMALIYLYLVLSPWPRFRTAADQGAIAEAAAALDRIRIAVAVNLALGIVTVLAGATGRYW